MLMPLYRYKHEQKYTTKHFANRENRLLMPPQTRKESAPSSLCPLLTTTDPIFLQPIASYSLTALAGPAAAAAAAGAAVVGSSRRDPDRTEPGRSRLRLQNVLVYIRKTPCLEDTGL